ncbi:3-isopropylmalate dehydratase small subunit [SAR86 cluster bacterium]|jgi:3-isopropylmalate/(R)-2-methylmalate dehydratase small subunit|nr:3-isopropylmalate dehydratase small subunit [Gammaproteobacteria bacterium]MDA9705270.1 3-isopropylmalate dehydratase small subunit [SAR86 cluster bacterium]MEC7197193.1 3-isopropylmalate dehydratase small subunit [Pseudomonadota bacterium]MDA9729349.1 3-isopropylmalate dehydratase small subunit [SAR86 cluster bacterium]MEC7579304.1 3-isopropylmalate dehydratase small subunit [Pseudomonadota bacterium]|tara:strand:- start:11169 stop:11810 length:642 start_codon:yes stop_codon:yes gene_type:complete
MNKSISNIFSGEAVFLDKANVDTDQIIPKQFLKSIKRTGFGPNLFDAWRYLDKGDLNSDNSKRKLNPDFILNHDLYKSCNILITRENFGCGSSREHAVWALTDYGFTTIIAPSFADIFKNNSYKNGLLLIEIDKEKIDEIFKQITEKKTINIEVDVHNQFIYLEEKQFPFELDDFKKKFLLDGIDEVGFTLQHQNKIEDFEKNYKKTVPWLFK